MPDPEYRKTACDSMIRCTIKQGFVNCGMIRSVLEYVSQHMMVNKIWTFQLSAIEILTSILRIKFPSLSASILNQYLDMALDVSYNSPTPIIKLSALKFLQALLLIFPSNIGDKLAEIRDVVRYPFKYLTTVRASISDKDPEVSSFACKMYPLIFRIVPVDKIPEFCRYLQNEISVLFQRADHPLVASDPLVNHLTLSEEERILKTSILSLGSLNDPALASSIVWGLLVAQLPFPNLLANSERYKSCFARLCTEIRLLPYPFSARSGSERMHVAVTTIIRRSKSGSSRGV